MSSKRHKIESEILKYRNESSWTKIDESTKLLSKKYGSSDGAVMMLEGEVKLEAYLQENQPRHQNIVKSRKELVSLKNKLQESMTSECKDSLFDVKLESSMLLCRLLYAQGNMKGCQNMINSLDLDKIESIGHCYKLRLLAEAYAINGLCLEHSNLKMNAKREDKLVIKQYERSTELSFEYITKFENLPCPNAEPRLSYGMEVAFQRGPLLHMKNGDVKTGIEKLRNVLQAKATTSVQQTIARDLATVLLRGICDETYRSPSSQSGEDEPKIDKITLKHGGGSPTATFTISPIDKTFSPTDCNQEAILLMIISEAMFNTDPMLDMSPEYANARSELLKESHTIYDLLAVALAQYSLYDVFNKSIEASLKYAYDQFHIWYQYGLSLHSAGRHDRAVRVLIECNRIQPKNPAPALLASKICYENLHDIGTGIGFAEKALEAASTANENDEDEFYEDYLPAAHLAVGMGHSYQCTDGTPIDKVKEFRSKAILHFSEAHNIDPHDYKPLLFLAVEFALDRRINDALQHVKVATALQPDNLHCLHLLVLLLSAQKQIKEAFAVLETVCKFYPENLSLLFTKCRLEMYNGKYEEALCACNAMTQIFKAVNEACANNAETMLDRLASDGLSVTNQSVGNDLDLNDGESFIGSHAVSRIERGLSDVESSLGGIHPKNVGMSGMPATNPSILQAHIWLLTAEVYLNLQRFDEAGQCVQEASSLFPLSHTVLYTRGRLAKFRGDLTEAITMFENTITIHPKHHKAMYEWAKILLEQKNFEFAEKLLQDAIKLNPMSHGIWLCLGDVLQELNDVEGAVDCITAAINIEATSPVIPFTVIGRDL